MKKSGGRSIGSTNEAKYDLKNEKRLLPQCCYSGMLWVKDECKENRKICEEGMLHKDYNKIGGMLQLIRCCQSGWKSDLV